MRACTPRSWVLAPSGWKSSSVLCAWTWWPKKGLAAHWRYKGGKSDATDQWMNNIRDILETADSGSDAADALSKDR